MNREKPFIIAVFHQKGGVGKTTTSLQLGAWFAAKHISTLMVDLDPSANLSAGVGVALSDKEPFILDVLLGNQRLSDVVKPTKIPLLSLVPSHQDMQLASKYLNMRPHYSSLLRIAFGLGDRLGLKYQNEISLQGVPRNERRIILFDRIIMDCSPTIDSVSITALSAADLVLIPTLAEYFSVKALEGVFRLIETVRAETNALLDYRIFVTMFDKESDAQKKILEKLRLNYSDYLLNSVIENDRHIQYSQLMAEPIFALYPKSNIAQQYISLAKEINNYENTRCLRS